MIDAPASGERAALRGYRWQYDHIAARVYIALLDGNLDSLRLTDPQAGRVDDLLLIRSGRVDCYQFKSVEHDRALTFNQVVKNQRTRGGNTAPSLLRSLADGWLRLREHWDNVYVHLVTQQYASVHDHVVGGEGTDKPSPDHFSAFLTQVLVPLRFKETILEDVDAGWRPVLEKLREASGLSVKEFGSFLESLHIDVAAGSGLPVSPSTGYSDIIALSSTLERHVSNSLKVVVLDSRDVLNLMGWQNRPRLHNRHEFPIDLDTYEPLAGANDQLTECIARHNRGYLAVIGPPGCGKSTLLSQTLSGSTDRIFRYYAYVPGSASTRTRLTGRGFLHDVVLMLAEGGIGQAKRELPSADIDLLRLQFIDQLDAAGAEFQRTSLRTIIVVDGLDHVNRDYSGSDGLLEELPRPDALPEGVLFIVGSRTLDPLHAYATQQLRERQGVVDLQQHRLLPTSILKICRRVPFTASLPREMHQRIVELSDGHPLALNYLLNRLRDADGRGLEDAFAELPAYGGNVEAEYLAVWDEVKENSNIVEILAICSRLRIAIRTEWVAEWAPSAAVETFRRKLLYLFRRHHDGWRFFHDSFRQFAADRTAWGDDAQVDDSVDAGIHKRIADLCANGNEHEIASEQLYHCYCARQYEQVISLAQQKTFREQYRRLRSPDLIREDIGLALSAAAGRADVLAVFRLLLGQIEMMQRTWALDDVDMPGVLHAAGLVNEAISWCSGHGRSVPSSHVYGLAARLGWDNDPAGRQLFEIVEHKGFADEDGIYQAGLSSDSALAWTRAAVLFRPLPTIITGIRNIVQIPLKGSQRDRLEQAERWNLFEKMTRTLINCAVVRCNEGALETIDSTLADHAEAVIQNKTQPEEREAREHAEKIRTQALAVLLRLRILVKSELLDLAETGDKAQCRLQELLALLQRRRLPSSTWLAIGEICYRYNFRARAAKILRVIPYNHQITVRDLGFDGETDAIDRRFRYWKLSHLLSSKQEDLPRSIPPGKETPAGGNAPPGAPVHSDVDAIELAGRIDGAVRRLAELGAKIASGRIVLASEVWTALLHGMHVFGPISAKRSSSYRAIEKTKLELMEVVVAVAGQYGGDIPQRLADTFTQKFVEWPEGWPLTLRLDLADKLRSTGARVPWYAETLSAMERSVETESVDSRLSDAADLVYRYARDGQVEPARRLAYGLIPLAFGVGFRKDYQFSVWVDWLKNALADTSGKFFVAEAAWLARLLSASDDMSERASGLAATELPAAVVPADPLAAVRIFEFLVRQGTVNHCSALACLVQALTTHSDSKQETTITLAADITADLISPAANRAYPDVAKCLVDVAAAALGRSAANSLVESVAERTDKYALPTTRGIWRRGLGLGGGLDKEQGGDVAQSDDDTYGALELSDGRRIARKEVAGRVETVSDVIALRKMEDKRSSFDWSIVLEGIALDRGEIKMLSNVFGYDGYRDGEVQVLLAEAAEKGGERELALCLAYACLRSVRGESWANSYGGWRLRAAKIVIDLGDDAARVEVCENLAHQIRTNPEWAGFLISDLHTIAEMLDPGLTAATIWPEIRTYLEGMAETLTLPEEGLLDDRRSRWWLEAPTNDRRASVEECTTSTALAELSVGHLSHRAWLVRDAATNIIVRALGRGDEEVAKALVRFAQSGASDDILERAGRCLAGARLRYESAQFATLEPLEHILANHRSQIIRGLACDQSPKSYRALSPVYQLALPSPSDEVIGSKKTNLWPYEEDYTILANFLQLDPGTLLAVAVRYASEALAILPKQETVRSALEGAHMKHVYPSVEIDAARAAYGRILAEIVDARLLNDKKWKLPARVLRTIDLEMIGRSPEARPPVVPTPPTAGHDQTIERWREEIEDRVEEYVAASVSEGCILVGARCRLTVLNWGHLEEEFICDATIGGADPYLGNRCVYRNSATLRDLFSPAEEISATDGTPLLFENETLRFYQANSNWISFRPGLARALAWIPDEESPGCWSTKSGELAVQTVWWVDGWWGRFDRTFDDTEAEGHVVILTSRGMADLVDKFGDITRHFILTRRGLDNGMQVDPVSIEQSVPLNS